LLSRSPASAFLAPSAYSDLNIKCESILRDSEPIPYLIHALSRYHSRTQFIYTDSLIKIDPFTHYGESVLWIVVVWSKSAHELVARSAAPYIPIVAMDGAGISKSLFSGVGTKKDLDLSVSVVWNPILTCTKFAFRNGFDFDDHLYCFEVTFCLDPVAQVMKKEVVCFYFKLVVKHVVESDCLGPE
jgi:hypothetical protein